MINNQYETVGKCLGMGDAAVLIATAASIFGAADVAVANRGAGVQAARPRGLTCSRAVT